MAHIPVRNTNDGTLSEPYLRTDLNLGTLADLPDWSKAPKASDEKLLLTLQAAGFQGVQGGDPVLCRKIGMGCTGSGRVNKPSDIPALVENFNSAGFDCATLHVGWGHESDAEIDALVREIILVSAGEDLPLYIETHRATITQDTWRTVQMIERNPDVRINADFSHWYTGLEMPYGNIEEKFNFLEPVFERVRFFHGRCGNSSHIQLPLNHPSMTMALAYFSEMWMRSFKGFLRSAKPGDYISFNPELLQPSINYAPTSITNEGHYEEQSDRWLDALQLTALARKCFDAAWQDKAD